MHMIKSTISRQVYGLQLSTLKSPTIFLMCRIALEIIAELSTELPPRRLMARRRAVAVHGLLRSTVSNGKKRWGRGDTTWNSSEGNLVKCERERRLRCEERGND